MTSANIFCLSNEMPSMQAVSSFATIVHQAAALCLIHGCVSSVKVMTCHGSCGLVVGRKGGIWKSHCGVLFDLSEICAGTKQQKFPCRLCPPARLVPASAQAAKSKPLCPT